MTLDQSRRVRLPYRLDGSSAAAARAALHRAIDEAPGDVVVDMSDVEWIDVTGLGLLAAAHERLHRRGDQLVLHHPSPGLRRTLAVTRLGRVLTVAS